MNPLIFAFISAFGWGTGDIFGVIASRKVGGYTTTLGQFAVATILFGLYIPWALADLQKITPVLLGINILLGLFYVVGNVTFNEAVRISKASLVGPIAGSFPAVTTILSLLFLKESLSPMQAMFIVIIFIGILLSTVDFKKLAIVDKGIFLALFSMISWGTYFTFIKLLMSEIGWFWPNYISMLLFPLIFVYMKSKKIKFTIPKPSIQRSIALSSLLLRGGDFSLNVGASMGLTSLVAPVAGSYPIIFTILAFVIFKEQIRRLQMLGIITTLIGIVALSIVSS